MRGKTKVVIYFVISVAIIVFYGLPMLGDPWSPNIDVLLDAPVQLEVDGYSFNLSTFIWRDFMPTSGNSHLIAIVDVSVTNVDVFPSNINVTMVWIIYESEVWEAELKGTSDSVDLNVLRRVARGGPKWPPGEMVDVVVYLVVEGHSHGYLLRASNQIIEMTM